MDGAIRPERNGNSMRVNNVTIKVGGEAGSGVATVGLIIAKLMQRSGLQVFMTNDYPSIIKGGHNTLTVRVSSERIYSLDPAPDILIALDKLTIAAHAAELAAGGAIIYDSAKVKESDAAIQRTDVRLLGVPLSKIATEAGGEIFFNQAAVGATLALLGMDLALHNSLIESTFGRKGADVVGKNKQAAKAGHEFIKNEMGGGHEASGQAGHEATSGRGAVFGITIQPQPPVRRTLLINGNDAVCAGAVAAGVQLVAEYPMSPSSSVLHWMAAHATKYNIVVKHTEDEIAAMNWLCGAGFAGVRCLTATSGGGFSLMAEALGNAGIAEISCVVVEDQRAGPSTGLPTYTEQADLQFALHASQGEFPRIVACPGDPAEAFYMAFDVFNMADLVQTPAIILMDKYLAESAQTVSYFKSEGLKINRGLLQSDAQMENYASEQPAMKPATLNGPWAVGVPATSEQAPAASGAGDKSQAASVPASSSKPIFKRHLITPSGISPRSIPGQKNGIHVCSSYEHDETGFTSEEAGMRAAMVDKRERKMRAISPLLYQPAFFGEQDADFLLVSWGSTKGPALEALKTLRSLNISVKYMHIRYASPFATDAIRAALKAAKRHLIIEGNSQGQMRNLIREKTGHFIENFYGRYDARPLEPAEIVAQVKACIGSL